MQTASAELTAALTSREREVVCRVKADWMRDSTYAYDPGIFNDVFSDTFEAAGDIGDLTPFLVSATVDRSLSTDLPEVAKLIAGSGAAEATMTLAGTLSGGVALTRVLTSHGGIGTTMRRVNTPIYVEMGAVGATGAEYLRQFTGKIRSLSVDPAGTVTITALDGRERMRTPVSLPLSVNVSAGTFMTSIAAADSVTTSFETSKNTLVTTPPTEVTDPWETLQQIAAAEQGVIFFDENDMLRFYNRDHMYGGAAVATLTTDSETFSNLKALTSGETIDSVANHVTVPAVPMQVDAPGATVWSATEVLAVDPSSSIVVPVEFPGPLYTFTAVDYLASSNADGTGGAPSVMTGYLYVAPVAVTASTWTLTISNLHPTQTAYLVRTSVDPPEGEPYLIVGGQCIRPAEAGYVAVSSDPGSISVYGRQPLDVGQNVWRQALVPTNSLAVWLLVALREPHPTLSGVEIVGDPRLQLTDRVQVVELDGLALDGEFWLVRINTKFSASDGLAQSVTLRGA